MRPSSGVFLFSPSYWRCVGRSVCVWLSGWKSKKLTRFWQLYSFRWFRAEKWSSVGLFRVRQTVSRSTFLLTNRHVMNGEAFMSFWGFFHTRPAFGFCSWFTGMQEDVIVAPDAHANANTPEMFRWMAGWLDEWMIEGWMDGWMDGGRMDS